MKPLFISLLLGCSLAFAEPPKSPPRTLKDFAVIRTEKLTAAQILERFGPPDRDIGSGIYIFEYDLSDGKKVRIHTSDRKALMAATWYDPKTKKGDLIYK